MSFYYNKQLFIGTITMFFLITMLFAIVVIWFSELLFQLQMVFLLISTFRFFYIMQSCSQHGLLLFLICHFCCGCFSSLCIAMFQITSICSFNGLVDRELNHLDFETPSLTIMPLVMMDRLIRGFRHHACCCGDLNQNIWYILMVLRLVLQML